MGKRLAKLVKTLGKKDWCAGGLNRAQRTKWIEPEPLSPP